MTETKEITEIDIEAARIGNKMQKKINDMNDEIRIGKLTPAQATFNYMKEVNTLISHFAERMKLEGAIEELKSEKTKVVEEYKKHYSNYPTYANGLMNAIKILKIRIAELEQKKREMSI